jgi:hypothetical protein
MILYFTVSDNENKVLFCSVRKQADWNIEGEIWEIDTV